MWKYVLILVVLLSFGLCEPQLNRPARLDHGRGFDIRLAVPGQPGTDYPTLGNIPRTSFSCSGKEPGYYADLETNCQVFRVCTRGSTYGFQSFVCPNGTLFNQAVFVCDWWMNVRCEKSQEMFSQNNDKFGNLKLGMQLMKDVKKMITYPMRNPYDKNTMNSKLVVMQEYIPPNGQMFMTGTGTTNFLPLKQNLVQNSFNNDLSFAASTPSSLYVPATYNTLQNDAEVFQRQKQRQNGQYNHNRAQTTQNIQSNIVSNGHAGRIVQTQHQQNAFQRSSQSQYMQTNNFGNSQTFNNQQNQNQGFRQFGQYSDGKPAKLIAAKPSEFGTTNSKQQYYVNPTQSQEQYTYKTPVPQFSTEINGQAGNFAKQNLVSQQSSNVIAKTLTINRIIQEPKPNGPRSRITFKTWLVKPSKSSKLVASSTPNSYQNPTPYTYETPTPYKYDRPSQLQAEKLVSEASPYYYSKPTPAPLKVSEPEAYVYNKPTAAPLRATEPGSYIYNKPTAAPLRAPEPGPYVYNRPSAPAKQIATEPPRIYLPPTTPQPTLSGRLYLPPSSVAPTKPARLYIPPTTYKPNAKLYLSPSLSPLVLSQQYLPAKPQNEQLRASPTTPTPVYALPTNENLNSPSFTLTKHSRINANHNNLTFADILTKEKLDITVNDIVKDTSKILNEATPNKFEQIKSVDYVDENYLPPDGNNKESDEVLTSQTPVTNSKSSRLIAQPSIDLEPPLEQQLEDKQDTNPLVKLPFFQEPTFPSNTIERTVSLKITIPERIATYLFKNNNESDSERLEILNTGSSNYLVLTNNNAKNTNPSGFVPIGKLIENKNSNVSNSQELVYKFIQDSLNVAKEYGNIAQQNPSQFQNLNNEDITQITNKISQLTASQYSGNQYNNANINNAVTSTANVPNINNQLQQIQSTQFSIEPSQQTAQEHLAAQVQNAYNEHIQSNQNQVYSGQLYQLPVPDVTNQLYNTGNSAEVFGQDSEAEHLQQQIPPTQSSPQVEIIQSQSVPIAPAKLQQEPSGFQTFNSQENTQEFIQRVLNSGDGIAAQVQDKIVGTIPHPSADNKLVTYKNDKSYYVITRNNNLFGQNNNQNAKLVQNNYPNVVTYQLVPSVSYQLEDVKDQQRILDAFSIDEFGNPKNRDKTNGRLTADVNYSVNHPVSAKQLDTLYSGPSSYSAPQASVGSLDRRGLTQNSVNSRLEKFDDSNDNIGYGRATPSVQFTF